MGPKKQGNNADRESLASSPNKSVLGALCIILVTPLAAVLVTHVFVHHGGSILSFYRAHESIKQIWPSAVDPTAWKIIGTFMAVQLLFMRLVPGKTEYGPVTLMGNKPAYKANGFQSFVLTIALFLAGVYYELFPAGIVYDYAPEIISALNLFSFVFCLVLYLKGILGWYSSSDAGSCGNPIYDFYWGIELYPRIFGWDVKLFAICRFGMMSWGVAILSYAFKQRELYGFVSDAMVVSIALQLIYIAKFFSWEMGYMRTLDIIYDRSGYYLCWGCIVWVPAIYTSTCLYLVKNPVQWGTPVASLFVAAGIFLIWMNYDADQQRMLVRETNGKCKIWGKPAEYIVGHYVDQQGKPQENLLLASGWWGLSRHFHYVPEILGSLAWTIPAGFSSPAPYFYAAYLTGLLIQRASRDNERCSRKYKKDWAKYCERVPYLIIPKIY